MKYKGSCHCGRIAFSVEGEIAELIECNCSICSRKGALLWRVPQDSFHLLTPGAEIGAYIFGEHRIRHRFCPTCGIHLFAEGAGKPGAPLVVVNVRCLEEVDISALPVKHFDGRSL